jgi:hypothetical protein
MSRADKARLVRAGVRGLLDRAEEVPGEYVPSLHYEAQDPLKAT